MWILGIAFFILILMLGISILDYVKNKYGKKSKIFKGMLIFTVICVVIMTIPLWILP